jgi:ribosome-binding protein aMBF1 (putative translation factor)
LLIGSAGVIDKGLFVERASHVTLFNGSTKKEKRNSGRDPFQWAYEKHIAGDPEEVALYELERIKADVAQAVYDLRNQSNLSRKELAELVGTTESVIENIEEADYEGDFLAMASRIAAALHTRV